MSCIIWNARGLGNRRAFSSLQRLVWDQKPALLFISESKIRSCIASRWKCVLNFSGFFGVDAVGRSGGLLLFWTDAINVSLRSYSVGHIDC